MPSQLKLQMVVGARDHPWVSCDSRNSKSASLASVVFLLKTKTNMPSFCYIFLLLTCACVFPQTYTTAHVKVTGQLEGVGSLLPPGRIRNKKSTRTSPSLLCFASYSWAWDLTWSVVNLYPVGLHWRKLIFVLPGVSNADSFLVRSRSQCRPLPHPWCRNPVWLEPMQAPCMLPQSL